jgi:hypothetical protein
MSAAPEPASGLAEETLAPDEAAVTARFIAFLEEASARRHPTGVVRRFNQGRHSGCVEAEFTVLDNLAPELRVGLFAEPRTFPTRIRFANATSSSDRDRDVRGMSIQVRNVMGDNLTPGATTQDFVLNSHPVMITPGPSEFLELLQAVEAGGLTAARFFVTHPKYAFAAASSRNRPSCHLDIPYWSTTPYLFGPGRAVKYIARPVAPSSDGPPSPLTDTYLRDALRARLSSRPASFEFLVQFRVPGKDMPIEDATVEWRERDSPYRAVARITIPRQEIDSAERESFCETVAFNPWHCLPDHRPLGGMNRARRDIYPALARFRSSRQGATAAASA